MAVANVCDGSCKRLQERLQTFAVKRGSAQQGRMQCTASEMGKTGTEIVSPIQDKRTGRRDAPVAPLEISTEPIYLVILVLFAASGCKKKVKGQPPCGICPYTYEPI